MVCKLTFTVHKLKIVFLSAIEGNDKSIDYAQVLEEQEDMEA